MLAGAYSCCVISRSKIRPAHQINLSIISSPRPPLQTYHYDHHDHAQIEHLAKTHPEYKSFLAVSLKEQEDFAGVGPVAAAHHPGLLVYCRYSHSSN
jgi:hypothetical protein